MTRETPQQITLWQFQQSASLGSEFAQFVADRLIDLTNLSLELRRHMGRACISLEITKNNNSENPSWNCHRRTRAPIPTGHVPESESTQHGREEMARFLHRIFCTVEGLMAEKPAMKGDIAFALNIEVGGWHISTGTLYLCHSHGLYRGLCGLALSGPYEQEQGPVDRAFWEAPLAKAQQSPSSEMHQTAKTLIGGRCFELPDNPRWNKKNSQLRRSLAFYRKTPVVITLDGVRICLSGHSDKQLERTKNLYTPIINCTQDLDYLIQLLSMLNKPPSPIVPRILIK